MIAIAIATSIAPSGALIQGQKVSEKHCKGGGGTGSKTHKTSMKLLLPPTPERSCRPSLWHPLPTLPSSQTILLIPQKALTGTPPPPQKQLFRGSPPKELSSVHLREDFLSAALSHKVHVYEVFSLSVLPNGRLVRKTSYQLQGSGAHNC